jgi:hypothetical protein
LYRISFAAIKETHCALVLDHFALLWYIFVTPFPLAIMH